METDRIDRATARELPPESDDTIGNNSRRYHERTWTGSATRAKQGRGFFYFPHDSIQAYLESQPGPSLLPVAGNALESGIASSKAA